MRRQAILAASVLAALAVASTWPGAPRGSHGFATPAGAPSEASAAAATTPARESERRTPSPTSRPLSASLDERPFAEVRAELERLANAGDAPAALRLGRTLAYCNGYVPMTSEQLEDIAVKLATHGVSVSRSGREQSPEALLETLKMGAAQKKRDCRNVAGLDEKDADAQALHWIERSAALGNADAQAMYGSLAFSSYDARSALLDAEGVRERKRRAIDYLRKSLAQGDALALLELYESYSAGVLHPASAEAAYAHLYAYSLTPRASELAPELLEYTLASRAEALDPQARQRAQDEGRRLAACCGGSAAETP